MAYGRWIAGCVILATGMLVCGGCASMEELRQHQMAQRRLEAEKAELTQELYDVRTATDSIRTRYDSCEMQITVKDQLVANLSSENSGLEEKFRRAQDALEMIASRPVGSVTVGPGKLPAELDIALQQFANNNSASVSYDGQNGLLKWTSDLVFAFASDVVKNTAKDSLQRFSQIMSQPAASGFDVLVVGHTDSVPIRRAGTLQNHPTNRHLSVHRSIAVAKVLQDFGVRPERVGVMGFGQYRPLVPNDTPEKRAQNRRVEMYIVPAGTFSSGASTAASLSFTGKPVDENTK
jgi:chemotaxis protein MotB